MSAAHTETPVFGRGASVSLGSALWVGAAAVFVLLRAAFAFHAPVGGFELEHLSGAWQAHVGAGDSRFVPTLFQAISALLFEATTSETPARLLALLATATVPLALYLSRQQLGDAGALAALFLLAMDGPAIAAGASASAMGFDVALMVWLFAALARGGLPPAAWAAIGFLGASAGPLALPLAVAAAGTALSQRAYPSRAALGFGAAGALGGIVAASLRFGLGWDGLRAPPFILFAQGFDDAWSAATTLELAVIYALPLLAAGLAAWAATCCTAYRSNAASRTTIMLLAWCVVALGWFVVSLESRNPAALVALTTPLGLLAGPVIARAAGAVWRADWTLARFLVPASLVSAALAAAFAVQWARLGRVGDANEKVLVAGFLVLAFSCLGYVASNRDALAALLVPALVLASVPTFSSAFAIVMGSRQEVAPSPVSPGQARELRAISLEVAAERGGGIVVHPTLEQDITWPFRDSGTLLIASRVPDAAAIVIWPAGIPAPQGYTPLAGDWNLKLAPAVPPRDILQYVRWFTNRNSLPINPETVAVYVKGTK